MRAVGYPPRSGAHGSDAPYLPSQTLGRPSPGSLVDRQAVLRQPFTSMNATFNTFQRRRSGSALSIMRPHEVFLFACLFLTAARTNAGENLLKNPGFEEPSPDNHTTPHWAVTTDSQSLAQLTDQEAHAGRHAILIPANSSIEQQVTNLPAGSYLARCRVKSQSEQYVSLILENPARPWAAYNYSEIKVPKGQWTQIEAACSLDRDGSVKLTLGGFSQEFRSYHGSEQAMRSSIIADDFELTRYEPSTPEILTLWDLKKEQAAALDWRTKSQWSTASGVGHAFTGTPAFQARHLAGVVRPEDGGVTIYSVSDQGLKERGVIVPSPPFKVAACALVSEATRTGIRVTSENGNESYTAWVLPTGLIRIESDKVSRFQVRDCRLRYGILPSFVGTDIIYAPARMPEAQIANIPSTQWFVGLVDGNDSMLVAAWDTDAQSVALGVSGAGKSRVIDTLLIDTEKGGFALSYVEHPGLWHKETLQEDWLGEYTPIAWQRPFEARWMGEFFASPGGKPSFHEPCMDYAFPVANAKTRMWGVWFEDWNHYPFYFDGSRTILHFEKSFVPAGNALIYFLEPATSDLYSPCEIVEQALGKEKAASIFDLDANKIRKLTYSTPDGFMYDRPVCATTTRLSHIKQTEKATIGVNLATHLYEFIQGIRGRVDQYDRFFAQIDDYLNGEGTAHPEMKPYLSELKMMVADAKSRTKQVYATPLPVVRTKIDSMKKLLEQGQDDGFDCGNLDVRGPAGAQDDLCRRYNRVVMRLMQTAALNCGDSPGKAVVAKYLWDQSRQILREPTRWESRRTLYFFEP